MMIVLKVRSLLYVFSRVADFRVNQMWKQQSGASTSNWVRDVTPFARGSVSLLYDPIGRYAVCVPSPGLIHTRGLIVDV